MIALVAAVLLQVDTSPAAGIAVLHRGRPKPLDSFAREFMHEISGSAKFRGYKDLDGTYVEVFKDGNAVVAVLGLMARPAADVRSLRFIRIDHLELKKELGLPEKRIYFSLADLEPVRGKLLEKERAIERDEATVAERAVLQVLEKHFLVEAVVHQRLLEIVPVPFGPRNNWMTPADLRGWLAGSAETNQRADFVKAALDRIADRRDKLAAIVASYDAMSAAFAAGKDAEFAAAARELQAAVREINPDAYPSVRVIETELTYNRVHPFGWAAALLGAAAFIFLLAFAFQSAGLRWAAMILSFGALALQGYGYAMRWIACGQYPLSNHYESMMMMAIGATIIGILLEAFLRVNIAGMAAGIAGAVLVLLADNVYQFASQSFINPLQPALMNTIWMTIHVPTIMLSFACALILSILGHVYLFTYLRRPGDHERLEPIHRVMHRVLQITVLLMLAGIILGAVWAGEAWGRPWGWDMKEVWALIALLTYLAMMHARFAGAIQGFGTAVWSLGGLLSVVLCYYGVNFLFGQGLHTYGFGAGGDNFWRIAAIGAFFGLDALLIAAASFRWAAHREATKTQPPGLEATSGKLLEERIE